MVQVILLSVMLFMAMPASAEYYQYHDYQGNQVFTDDIANIPEDQRPDIKTFESVQSNPPQDMTGNEAVREEDTADGDKEGSDGTETDMAQEKPSTVGADSKNVDELKATREELRKTLDGLEAERTAIGPPPPNTAKPEIKAAYNAKVSELNRKIVMYQERTKEFDEQVKAYNSQRGK